MLESKPAHSLLAEFPQCSSLAVCEFYAASEEHCKQDYGQVCAKLWCRMLWRLKHIKMVTSMYMSSADLLSVHYARILHGGQLHKGPQLNKNCQNWRVGTCVGMLKSKENSLWFHHWSPSCLAGGWYWPLQVEPRNNSANSGLLLSVNWDHTIEKTDGW